MHNANPYVAKYTRKNNKNAFAIIVIFIAIFSTYLNITNNLKKLMNNYVS